MVISSQGLELREPIVEAQVVLTAGDPAMFSRVVEMPRRALLRSCYDGHR
jgi:hypothetical protein